MAAILVTALTFGTAFTIRPTLTTVPVRDLPRRSSCRWVVDPDSGRLVAAWETDKTPDRRPPCHLTVVRS